MKLSDHLSFWLFSIVQSVGREYKEKKKKIVSSLVFFCLHLKKVNENPFPLEKKVKAHCRLRVVANVLLFKKGVL